MRLGPLATMALVAGLAPLLIGCALVPGHTEVPPEQRTPGAKQYHYLPENYEGGYSYMQARKLNPLWWYKNSDEPVVPDWYLPEEPYSRRELKWHTRNPFHNFTYYVIGVADRPFVRTGGNPGSVWGKDGGWNFTMTHAGPVIHLPCLSYKGKTWEWYLGWRGRGNFGAAFRPGRNTVLKKDHPQPEAGK